MSETLQSRTDLSRVELLLDQQKYEEALAPLSQLIEENPADPQIRIYRLLAVRILLLRQTLARSVSQTVEPPRAVFQAMSSKAVKTPQAFAAPSVTQWFGSIGRSVEASLAGDVAKRAALGLVVAGLFVTPMTFCLGVSEQPLVGGNKQSFRGSTNVSAISASSLKLEERATAPIEEPSLDPLPANQLPNLHRINGDWQTSSKLEVVEKSPDSERVLKPEPVLDGAKANHETRSSRQRPSRKLAQELQTVYKTSRALFLREQPRFASASLQQIAGGTHLNLLGVNGDWLKVKTDSSAVGYLRKEFVIAADTTP